MNSDEIIVLDSGIGGLWILKELVYSLPNTHFIYFADYKNAPFGNLKLANLKSCLKQNLNQLIQKFNPQGVVLACNTATATAISYLRKEFKDIFFVGTEPALLPAIRSNKKNILILATKNTIKYNNLIKNYIADGVNISLKIDTKLATLIEQNINDLSKIKPYLYDVLCDYIGKIDACVLGCTHYEYVLQYIQQILGKDVKIFLGNSGVVRQVNRKTLCGQTKSKITFISSTKEGFINLKQAWQMVKNKEDICAE